MTTAMPMRYLISIIVLFASLHSQAQVRIDLGGGSGGGSGSSIDSSFVRNDSVFVAENGSIFYTGLNAFSSNDNHLDTIVQSAHNFNMSGKAFIPLGFWQGRWREANTLSDSTIQKSYLIDVLNDSTFVVQHGGILRSSLLSLLPGYTYYLRDDGSISISQDMDYVAKVGVALDSHTIAFERTIEAATNTAATTSIWHQNQAGDAGYLGNVLAGDTTSHGVATLQVISDNGKGLLLDLPTGSESLQIARDAADFYYLQSQGNDLKLDATGSLANNHLFLKRTGEVGVGTDAPTATIDVNGAARIRSLPTVTSTNDLVAVDANGNLSRISKDSLPSYGYGMMYVSEADPDTVSIGTSWTANFNGLTPQYLNGFTFIESANPIGDNLRNDVTGLFKINACLSLSHNQSTSRIIKIRVNFGGFYSPEASTTIAPGDRGNVCLTWLVQINSTNNTLNLQTNSDGSATGYIYGYQLVVEKIK
ncbi:MAG: hypothetical protein D6706_08415 [Chloroflexi bacterium]|nr:MAG: hypothetical protein D6706_08415 [Chloroflexota bacterium]